MCAASVSAPAASSPSSSFLQALSKPLVSVSCSAGLPPVTAVVVKKVPFMVGLSCEHPPLSVCEKKPCFRVRELRARLVCLPSSPGCVWWRVLLVLSLLPPGNVSCTSIASVKTLLPAAGSVRQGLRLPAELL